MKCSICKATIEETFLKKIVGTYIKDKKGKLQGVCSSCQQQFKNNKEAMLQSS
ncbi:hypothetical protein HYW21_03685 [Candidatus Woesearchaeota archaeon]|nr:hypothetical protein [Candidatus Woesearchaeota archaeon]